MPKHTRVQIGQAAKPNEKEEDIKKTEIVQLMWVVL